MILGEGTSDVRTSVDPTAVYCPSHERIAASGVTAFIEALRGHTGEALQDYAALHAFSVREFRTFWRLFVEWARGLDYAGELEPVCVGDVCEHAEFFPRVELNYADNLLNFNVAPATAPALTARHADGSQTRLTRKELRERVARLAAALEQNGLRRGDRVAAVMRNDERAIIVALAVTAIGATLSTAAPEMGGDGLVNRFGQLSPKWLFAHVSLPNASNGKILSEGIAQLASSVESLERLIVLEDGLDVPCRLRVDSYSGLMEGGDGDAFVWRRFPFNHPLFIMFSSGTTGKPKCIVHGAGGSLVEHLKEHRLHSDLGPQDKLYFHTSCSWMMWNWQLSALASGVEIVVYDGPISSADTLWQMVADERVTVFGTSPAYLQMSSETGIEPGRQFDLSALRALMSTGAVLFDAQFRWVLEHVKPLQIQSISGGTDILGCFVLGNPNLPVWLGEAQCRSLGLDVQAWDAGGPVADVGELVCANPFPSRPLGFFGDADGSRFHAAYFGANPGVWTHGDQIEFSRHGGARLHGRSDGVLNVHGVKVGPGEIYRVLSDVGGIREAVVVERRTRENDDARAYDRRIVLFVVLEEGVMLTGALIARIRYELVHRNSRAHVPDVILPVDALPVTHSGKLSDSAVRSAVNGLPVGNTAALRNPECLDAIRNHPGLSVDPPGARPNESPWAGETAGDAGETLEVCLTRVWERLFGFAPISCGDNFFDLGGDSLLGTALAAEVSHATGHKMTLAMLLAAPTIAELAARIQGATGDAPSRILLPIRDGTGVPIFWVHSLAGTVIECRRVINAMKTARPIYGLHAKGLDGDEEPLDCVRKMAECYIRELRSIQPHGPYTLIGYSFGGLVAYEMARQLHRSGEPIGLLCLLDTHVHDRCLPWQDRLQYQTRYAARQWRMFREVSPAQRSRFILRKLAGAADKIRLRLGRAAHQPMPEHAHMPVALMRMREAMRVAMTTYRLPRYDGGPVNFVRSALTVGDLCDPLPAWRRVARGGFEIWKAGGSHVEMILGRNAEPLAATLDRVLLDASAGRSGDLDFGAMPQGGVNA
ncbi:Acetoacetyl-CoA synthetase [Paraburkholderia piptadeniae]|uniref:Acetoacetyl-CoA synthetase n=1 Tax=Paraburkholderia piptadeniae TaxID=1701573 RepID=A0A1N7SXB6_9BURK|nr:acetoacetate--CoA ligase [Paraburkholderia piptadeniae]SIT52022.1 Acetoacetyl-CoA synthetase [Paraburkholderia piptadeniae]